jgi:hypothetical protein
VLDLKISWASAELTPPPISHLTLIAYKEYADQVSGIIRNMVVQARVNASSVQNKGIKPSSAF